MDLERKIKGSKQVGANGQAHPINKDREEKDTMWNKVGEYTIQSYIYWVTVIAILKWLVLTIFIPNFKPLVLSFRFKANSKKKNKWGGLILCLLVWISWKILIFKHVGPEILTKLKSRIISFLCLITLQSLCRYHSLSLSFFLALLVWFSFCFYSLLIS